MCSNIKHDVTRAQNASLPGGEAIAIGIDHIFQYADFALRHEKLQLARTKGRAAAPHEAWLEILFLSGNLLGLQQGQKFQQEFGPVLCWVLDSGPECTAVVPPAFETMQTTPP